MPITLLKCCSTVELPRVGGVSVPVPRLNPRPIKSWISGDKTQAAKLPEIPDVCIAQASLEVIGPDDAASPGWAEA